MEVCNTHSGATVYVVVASPAVIATNFAWPGLKSVS